MKDIMDGMDDHVHDRVLLEDHYYVIKVIDVAKVP